MAFKLDTQISVNIITENNLPIFDYVAGIIFVLLIFHSAIYKPCDHGLRLACDKNKYINLYLKKFYYMHKIKIDLNLGLISNLI